MPIFEYQCRDCKHQFELLVTSSQQGEPIQCPQCKSTDVTKNISASTIRVGLAASTVRPGPSGGCSSPSGFS
ncbi:FmdB family zinc ribbon protein [Desulfogranum mediterraneum]|uniref:FmdB family zinc ribbon protein n=1 Tax=Desulfogranum mediterraneum TaxID=160661 RepID=UPI00040ED1DD|nr:zinc ribbon domain-containing protein [Desulfogranum mediterraneum]